ncbi:MAG: NYN domain-containing protein [Sedimentisphaerales bacterium]|nr:NYN domain-containing protein [Sedimentisphaerales bacterium]
MLIDGYNLLRAIENFSEHPEPITDVQLCMVLSRYLLRVKKKGTIVFDGTGPRDKVIFRNIRNLEVIFSGTSHEADDIIEKLILENTAPKRLVVVSSDRRVKAAAKKRRATSISSLDFWEEVIKQLEKKRRKPEPRQKFSGISEFETDLWLKEFGLKKDT